MPQPSSVPSNQTLPDRADIVIIGAGIAGISTALELAERGLDVVVFEKGIVAGEQSSRNWGWCRQMGRDPEELPLIKISMDLWRGMRQRINAEVGYREDGAVYLCRNEDELKKRQQWHDLYVKDHDLKTRMIGRKETAELAAGAQVDWPGGLFTPDDGRAEPTMAVSAMAIAAQRLGVKIFQNCAVRLIEREAGKIAGVVTEKGSVKSSTVVLCGGAWSRRFCHNVGIRLPQLSVVNSVMRTAPIEASIDANLNGRKFAIRKRLDGGYTLAHADYSVADIMPDSFRLFKDFWHLMRDERKDYKLRIGERSLQEFQLKRRWSGDEESPFEQVRILDPKPVDPILDEALAALCNTLPVFKDVAIEERWAGVIDVMPDVLPVISEVESTPGFFMATGFSGHGFGLGPGAGKLMAEIIFGETPCVDPTPFRLARF